MKALVNFGQGIYGDTGADLTPTMKEEDGTVIDVTNASSITMRWRGPAGQSGTISGSVVSPGTNGIVKFEDPFNVLDPGTAPSVAIDFIVTMVIATETFKSRAIGRYEILRWP